MYRVLLIMSIFFMNCRAMNPDLVGYGTPRASRCKSSLRGSNSARMDEKLFEVYWLEATLFAHIRILRDRMDELRKILKLKRQEYNFSFVLGKSASEVEKTIELIVNSANGVRRYNLLRRSGRENRIAQVKNDTEVIKELHQSCAQKTAELQGYVCP